MVTAKGRRLISYYNLPDMTFCCNDKCDKNLCKRKLSNYEERLLIENGASLSYAYFKPEECDQYKGEQ